jgi:hypothetical protein
MTAPTPETLDWLRQCAAAPGARWHRALLSEVEGQTPPEIEPIPAEGLAWLQQSARVHGATYSQVLLHVLERIELLDQDAIEQSQSNRFSFEAVIKRLEKLEAALQHDTLLIGGPQDKLPRMRSCAESTMTVQPAFPLPSAPSMTLAASTAPLSPQPPSPPPPVAPAGGLVERVVKVIADPDGPAELWHDDARAAIREVAAAARERIASFDPSLKWGDVAQWLEQEADRG